MLLSPSLTCGATNYHRLQAYVVRARGARCLLRRLEGLRIKSVDAMLVNANCSATYALRKHRMLGAHAGGSERTALDALWRQRLG